MPVPNFDPGAKSPAAFLTLDEEVCFEGVDVFLSVQGIPVRTLVPRSLLQARFQAGDSPESWVDCFVMHAEVIHRATVRRFAADPSNPVVLDERDV